MANKEHLAILKQGVDAWNRWREQSRNASIIPNLTGADLEDAELDQIDFRWTDLQRANLRGSQLLGANLTHADLRFTNLSDATLRNANIANGLLVRATLEETDLEGAVLASSVLWRALFIKATLRAADFTGAYMVGTRFIGVDLSNAVGLETVDHQGPSTIDVDTIYRSGSELSSKFLRGCGIPETLVREIPSLVGPHEGLEFYSCFISYSSEDGEFARRLYGRMRDAHLRVWFAPEDIHSGKKLHEQIKTAIRIYDKLLIVLSEASLRSEWVMTELRNARSSERQSGKRKLFPLRLLDIDIIRGWKCFDADSGTDLAVEVREYFIPDFSKWKDHDSFEDAFNRLLKSLRAED